MPGTNYLQPLSPSECQDIHAIWHRGHCLVDTELNTATITMCLPFTLPHESSLHCWPRKAMACKCKQQNATPDIEAAGEADAAAEAGRSSNNIKPAPNYNTHPNKTPPKYNIPPGQRTLIQAPAKAEYPTPKCNGLPWGSIPADHI